MRTAVERIIIMQSDTPFLQRRFPSIHLSKYSGVSPRRTICLLKTAPDQCFSYTREREREERWRMYTSEKANICLIKSSPRNNTICWKRDNFVPRTTHFAGCFYIRNSPQQHTVKYCIKTGETLSLSVCVCLPGKGVWRSREESKHAIISYNGVSREEPHSGNRSLLFRKWIVWRTLRCVQLISASLRKTTFCVCVRVCVGSRINVGIETAVPQDPTKSGKSDKHHFYPS